jgi:precorrin-2 dehydrogenase/sirohydrochlorin ferrochelatase
LIDANGPARDFPQLKEARWKRQTIGPKVNRLRYMDTQYYPVFLSLRGRKCLVVGGGAVGERKVRGLLGSGASIELVAERLTSWLEAECKDGRLALVGSRYREADLDAVDMVFAATNDAALNRRIAEDARKRRLLCNMATDPELGSFIVPSVFQCGALAVAISTMGLSPAMAKVIRKRIEKEFGPEWALSLELIGRVRSSVQAQGLEEAENARIFKAVAALPLPQWIRDGQHEAMIGELGMICGPWLNREKLDQLWNEIWQRSSS